MTVAPLNSATNLSSTNDVVRLFFTLYLNQPSSHQLLEQPEVIHQLARHGYGIAIAIQTFDQHSAKAFQQTLAANIPTIAWITPPPESGPHFNAQNYPQLLDRYQQFRHWSKEHNLSIDTIGLTIAPPLEVMAGQILNMRFATRRLWLAGDNVLYPAARAAYHEIIAAIRHDGYEVHGYQWPLIADDRRAGTTLVQRALEVVDIPADLDVLICAGSPAPGMPSGDLGGALVASYGPAADAIWISGTGLTWPSLQRDLRLAAQHSDMIYIDSLEQCVAAGWLTHINHFHWEQRASPDWRPRLLIASFRGVLFLTLIAARYGLRALGWSGWLLAFYLWWRNRTAKS